MLLNSKTCVICNNDLNGTIMQNEARYSCNTCIFTMTINKDLKLDVLKFCLEEIDDVIFLVRRKKDINNYAMSWTIDWGNSFYQTDNFLNENYNEIDLDDVKNEVLNVLLFK